jgi:hypothetical protein
MRRFIHFCKSTHWMRDYTSKASRRSYVRRFLDNVRYGMRESEVSR